MTGDSTRRPTWRQSRLVEHSREADECRHPNIEPHGDPLQPRREGDGINRFAFQNIRGTDIAKGVEIPDEIDTFCNVRAAYVLKSEAVNSISLSPGLQRVPVRFYVRVAAFVRLPRVLHEPALSPRRAS